MCVALLVLISRHAHTIAVAEMDISLTKFIKCYKATNQGLP